MPCGADLHRAPTAPATSSPPQEFIELAIGVLLRLLDLFHVLAGALRLLLDHADLLLDLLRPLAILFLLLLHLVDFGGHVGHPGTPTEQDNAQEDATEPAPGEHAIGFGHLAVYVWNVETHELERQPTGGADALEPIEH